MKIYGVDAFTEERFKGNQAAVCILDKNEEDIVLQSIAKEMNLSETVFILEKDPKIYSLRWFTPTF